MQQGSKLLGLIQSRKFWASLIGFVSVLMVHLTGEGLPVDELVAAIVTIVSVFVGATALEDGLARHG